MRFFRPISVLSALFAISALAGCATQSTVTRGSDTAVRAEQRRISSTTHTITFADGPKLGRQQVSRAL